MIEIKKMTLEDFDEIKDVLQTEFDEFWTSSILKSELESYGFYVGVTKTSVAQDMALSTRGNKAKGYDLFPKTSPFFLCRLPSL